MVLSFFHIGGLGKHRLRKEAEETSDWFLVQERRKSQFCHNWLAAGQNTNYLNNIFVPHKDKQIPQKDNNLWDQCGISAEERLRFGLVNQTQIEIGIELTHLDAQITLWLVCTILTNKKTPWWRVQQYLTVRLDIYSKKLLNNFN